MKFGRSGENVAATNNTEDSKVEQKLEVPAEKEFKELKLLKEYNEQLKESLAITRKQNKRMKIYSVASSIVAIGAVGTLFCLFTRNRDFL